MKKLRILSLPYISWVCMFTIVPLLIVIFFAITTPSGEFTILNISNVGRYFSVIVKSILLASIATFISLIIAYPFSYIISRVGGKTGTRLAHGEVAVGEQEDLGTACRALGLHA